MRYQLKDICNPKQWKTIQTSEMKPTGYPVYGSNGIIGYYDQYNHKQPTILVTCRGATCGRVNICREYSYVTGNAMALDDLASFVNINYLCYLLQFDGLQSVISGTAQPQIVRNVLERFWVEIPDINTQSMIVSRLEKLETIIGIYQSELEELDKLVKSRFVEIFGDPVSNEKGLSIKLGKDIFKLSNGKIVPEEKRLDIGVPVYGGNGISWYTDTNLLEKATIVVGRVGFHSGNVHYAQGPLWVSDNAMYISELLDEDYDLCFLYYLMDIIDFTRFQDAGDLKKITQKPFMEMEFICPSKQKQHCFLDIVHQIDKSKSVIQRSLDEAQLLFDSLMQEYFG